MRGIHYCSWTRKDHDTSKLKRTNKRRYTIHFKCKRTKQKIELNRNDTIGCRPFASHPTEEDVFGHCTWPWPLNHLGIITASQKAESHSKWCNYTESRSGKKEHTETNKIKPRHDEHNNCPAIFRHPIHNQMHRGITEIKRSMHHRTIPVHDSLTARSPSGHEQHTKISNNTQSSSNRNI